MEALRFIFSSFWIWAGFMILLSTALYYLVNGIVRLCSRAWRKTMVCKHGWPPAHLDADGDWKPESKENK